MNGRIDDSMNSNYDFRVMRILRKRRHLTLEKLAEQSNLTYATVVAVESNKTHPSLKTLDALAHALHVSTSQLINFAEQRYSLKRKAQIKPQTCSCRIAQFGPAKMIHVTAQTGDQIEGMDEHGNVHEMCYIIHGIVDLHLEECIYRLEQYDTFLFNGMHRHSYHQIETGEFVMIHIPQDVTVIERLLSQNPQ